MAVEVSYCAGFNIALYPPNTHSRNHKQIHIPNHTTPATALWLHPTTTLSWLCIASAGLSAPNHWQLCLHLALLPSDCSCSSTQQPAGVLQAPARQRLFAAAAMRRRLLLATVSAYWNRFTLKALMSALPRCPAVVRTVRSALLRAHSQAAAATRTQTLSILATC